jgi:hypothetical protein
VKTKDMPVISLSDISVFVLREVMNSMVGIPKQSAIDYSCCMFQDYARP